MQQQQAASAKAMLPCKPAAAGPQVRVTAAYTQAEHAQTCAHAHTLRQVLMLQRVLLSVL